MGHGFSFKHAEKVMDSIENEQGRTCFGREEKNLICNYAFHIQPHSKTEKLAKEIAKARFEITNGYIDSNVEYKINQEIDHVNRMWLAQDLSGKKEYSPVPYSAFEGCDLTGLEYLLESGEMLHLCPTSPEYYVSENRLADGTKTLPHIYLAILDSDNQPYKFRQEDGAILENPYIATGANIDIQFDKSHSPLGSLPNVPNYILKDGTELLESECDVYGNYHGLRGIVGSGGLYESTGKLYSPMTDTKGCITAFRELEKPEIVLHDQKREKSNEKQGEERTYRNKQDLFENLRSYEKFMDNTDVDTEDEWER